MLAHLGLVGAGIGNGCRAINVSKCFAEHFHLQISRKFFIGQSPLGSGLVCCSRNKNTGVSFPVFLAPYRLTMLVVTGAVCRYHA